MFKTLSIEHKYIYNYTIYIFLNIVNIIYIKVYNLL